MERVWLSYPSCDFVFHILCWTWLSKLSFVLRALFKCLLSCPISQKSSSFVSLISWVWHCTSLRTSGVCQDIWWSYSMTARRDHTCFSLDQIAWLGLKASNLSIIFESLLTCIIILISAVSIKWRIIRKIAVSNCLMTIVRIETTWYKNRSIFTVSVLIGKIVFR